MRSVISRVVGRVLAVVFGAIMLVRRPRPIHARGIMLDGEITRLPAGPPSGIGWIDDADAPATATVARLSRSVGLPSVLPDVIGLAVRFEHGGHAADIEFASTGIGVPTRFFLQPHRSPSRARLGTLLPYRGRFGPVLLLARTMSPADLPAGGPPLAAALSAAPWRLRLYWATPRGKWHSFAELTLRRPEAGIPADLRFDAVRHLLPGAAAYEWVRQVRQPSYVLAQG
jgi:hypothetical protein